ncbi:armadillo repeat-containing protein 3-like [Acanthaster planci]|uniref:Armadillo repeat-containing protein 3-like n=1 Tax=Acanthaster planci TaxID=133434 RepID=A0A8B7ZEI7_ACAPL|nr:armadillo repeat-containing protein 3-like [Acanthaster planci]XP_022103271.1 armadillo repeat-containing protein 3-like [Acanthaster planci]XP_022103272.1 armadillo repeat-containing protein 3-like [Acanthaster planci]
MGKKNKKETEAPPKDIFDPLSVESKKAATVVLMLDSTEDDILIKSCEALYKFAEKCEENKALLMEMGAVPSLLKLITSEEKTVRRNATMTLGVMSAHPEVRRVLRKGDCIGNVIKLLSSEEETLVHEFASLCLASMAQEFTSKVQILEQDGLEPLIMLLADSDPDVQKNSVEAIFLLLQDYQTRTAIRELHGLESLLELLKSEYPSIQEMALRCLALCTLDVENREALREVEGLERLVEFVSTKEWEDLHVHALLVLSNCLEDLETMELIQNTGGLQKLLAFTTESPTPDVQMHAAKAIARAARNGENCKIFHEQEAEKTLISLLETSDNSQVMGAAAQALGIMAQSPICRVTIAEYDGIAPLIKLLNNHNGEAVESASLALANLTVAQMANCVEVADHNGVEPLIGLLGSSSREGAQANAAMVLTNMATDEILREDIQRRGVVGALVPPLLSTNTTVQSKAALALAAFVCDADSRNQLRGLGGLSPLLKLLQSGNDDVRRSASWAIVVCATDPLIATELCKLGGLDILKEIQLSSTRQNSFSDAALEKLLDSTLPAKYALMGVLGPNDIIQDGFYDAGRVRPDGKFLTLEELSKQEVDQKRPVLLINCGSTNASPPRSPAPATNSSELDVKTDTSRTNIGSKSSKSAIRGGKRETKKEKEERELRERLEAERLAEQEAILAQQPPNFEPPADPKLEEYITEMLVNAAGLPTTREQLDVVARFVSDKMGGPIERGQLSSFSYELSLSQLKYELKSNVLPIGRIEKGIHYHRALLFKTLCDRIGVACSLVRGDYNRAWNEVLLIDEDDNPVKPKFPPKSYIVDLIHHPGRLMRTDSIDAANYQKI